MGALWFVAFRKVNSVTTTDTYMALMVEELVRQSKFLSKLDLAKGFYQVKLILEAKVKTTFRSPSEKLEFTTRMPLGLRNAQATFLRLMDSVLGYCQAFAATYIDDVLVFS